MMSVSQSDPSIMHIGRYSKGGLVFAMPSEQLPFNSQKPGRPPSTPIFPGDAALKAGLAAYLDSGNAPYPPSQGRPVKRSQRRFCRLLSGMKPTSGGGWLKKVSNSVRRCLERLMFRSTSPSVSRSS